MTKLPPKSSAPGSSETKTGGATSTRILGVDAARGLALLGMMAVHIMPLSVLVGNSKYAPTWAGALFSGRASALFVVMAGVGLALLTGGAKGPAPAKLRSLRMSVLIRAMLITLIGFAVGELDSGVAVILVHYGLLFVAAIPFLNMRLRYLSCWATGWLLLSPYPYYALRNWLGDSLEDYQVSGSPTMDDLLDPGVLFSDLLVTGDYPLMVWFGFLLTGLCVGRLALSRPPVALALLVGGAIVAVGSKVLSAWLLGMDGATAALRRAADLSANELNVGLVTGDDLDTATSTPWFLAIAAPHTGAPLDVLHVTGCAVAVLGAAQLFCMAVTALLGNAGEMLLWPLTGAGSATLTIYCAHLFALDWFSDATAPLPRVQLFIYYALAALLIGMLLKFLGRRGPLEAMVHSVTTTLARTK